MEGNPMARGISLDVELARQVGLAPAIVYNELLFWNKKGRRADGWIYKSYEEMMDRLPLSESTIRRAYKSLEIASLITTKVMKVGEAPVLHYKLTETESVKLTETIETANLTETSIYTKKVPKEDGKLLGEIIAIINPNEKPTTDRQRMLNARLKDYGPADLVAAARELAKSEWHQENKQMSVDNLLAPSKFGRWYAAAKDTTPKKEVIF